jgi:hypothetical protein
METPMSTREARCSCGALRLIVTGEPEFVVACHCLECQRRTGSAFGVGAYFQRAQVQATGTSTLYRRAGQDGRELRLHFCPTCGSTVYWEADFRPGHFGVALGALGDTGLEAPHRSVWEQSRHPWVAFTHEPLQLPRQSPPATG